MLFGRTVRTFRHLRDHCDPVILRKTNDVSRLGLHSQSVAGVQVTRRTKTTAFLITSVSENNIFKSICKAVTLLGPRREILVGKVVVGGFEKSTSLFSSNEGVVRSLANIPMMNIVP